MNDKDKKLIEGGNENKCSINKAKQELTYVALIFVAGVLCIVSASYFESKNEKDEFYYHEPSSLEEISENSAADSLISDTENIEIIYPIDINLADQNDLCGVSGIGDYTAGLIIEYRNKAGILTDIDELIEIPGIGEKTIGLLKNYFYVSEKDFKKYQPNVSSSEYEDSVPEETTVKQKEPTPAMTDHVNDTEPEIEEPYIAEVPQRTTVYINSASAEELERALLISYEQACEIVSLRDSILYFSSIDELELIESFTLEDINSFKDYVIID